MARGRTNPRRDHSAYRHHAGKVKAINLPQAKRLKRGGQRLV